MRGTSSISRPDQLAAIASPVRQEIIDVLAGRPGTSIAVIAATLGRRPDALYYHVRELVRVGLLLRAGRGRGRRRREEALYRTVAPRLAVAYDPLSPVNVARVSKAVASMLRLGLRDFRRAFSSTSVIVSGRRRELWAGRVTGWLTGAQLERVNLLMKKIFRLFNEPRRDSRARLFATTIVLVPLERRPRRPGKEKTHARRP